MPKVFSDELRTKLRSYYPQQNAESCQHFSHPADTFVEYVLSAANNAAADMMWQEFNVTKQELRTEQKDMLKSLKDTQDKLRKLSPPFYRLLENGAAPLGVADSLEEIIRQIEATVPRIDALPQKIHPDQEKHNIAVEMASHVLPVLKANRIKISATYGSYTNKKDITAQGYDGIDSSQYISDAVKILKAIGDDIGLDLVENTWRDIISQVKKSSPDLQE